jgi:ATP-binding cassette, subfamily B, bacterial
MSAAAPGHATGAMGAMRELYGALWRHAEGKRGQLLGATALLTCSQLLRLTLPWLAAQAIDALQVGEIARSGR